MKRANSFKRQVLVLALAFALIAFYPAQNAEPQASGTVVSVEPQFNSARVGETFNVSITVSNVQNLYTLEVFLSWNSSVLQAQTVSLQLGVESHPGGVLHEVPGEGVFVVQDEVTQETGQYSLVATSVSPAASFNGSGTIASVTFAVVSVGHSEIELETILADYPEPDNTSTEIDHTDTGGSVDAVIPEFPNAVIIALLVALATFAVFFFKKAAKKNLTQAPPPPHSSPLLLAC